MSEEAVKELRPFVVSKPDGTESSVLAAEHPRAAATRALRENGDWDAVVVFPVERGKRYVRQSVAVPE